MPRFLPKNGRTLVSNNYIWYRDGVIHREDGPAIEYANGSKEWIQNDVPHRTDGPACEWYDGNRWWYQNGLLHRLDGPAIIYFSGFEYWYIHGEQIECKTQDEFDRIVKLKAFL